MGEPNIVTSDGRGVRVIPVCQGKADKICLAIIEVDLAFFDRANATLLHEALGRALAKEG